MESFFNTLNSYYWDNIQERQNLSDLIDPDSWINSLIHFCNYAFERAGSPAVYREAAIEALQDNYKWLENRERWGTGIENRIFESFKEACGRRYISKYNEKLNPLSTIEGNYISLLNFAWNVADEKSLTKWAIDLISADEIRNTFDSLRRIRGIGDKIASFYLRDLCILTNQPSGTFRDVYLLQPIDVWTERAARLLLNNTHATKRQCAQALIDLENELGLSPGVSNIGFWVFGAKIVDGISTYIEAVKAISERNRINLRNIVMRQITEEREWLMFLESLLP